MDIIDVLVAKALTPQGQIDAYAARAQKAVLDANAALEDAESAVANIDDITAQTTSNNATALASAEAANQALSDATEALELANDALAKINEVTIATLDTEIDKLTHALLQRTTENSVSYDFVTTYPSGLITTLQNLIKYYNSTGQNTDGTMTQKAITDALENAGSNIHFNTEDAGHIPVVKNDGTLGTSEIMESDLLEALAQLGIYHSEEAVGLTIDYEAGTFERVFDAKNLQAGSDFNRYLMYGGRRRCIVDRSGRIVAWYGDNNYIEDGSLGEVMVYQPKFYYQRLPIKTENSTVGKIVRKETIAISAAEQTGFKIHPAFVDTNGNILEYILLPAYESSYYSTSNNQFITDDSGLMDFNNDYLLSIAGAKPCSGVNNQFTVTNAEQMAKNIGQGWHITNAAAESVNQMLMLIELGTLNGQIALENGLSNLPNVEGYNCSSQTGSTASLGNTTGIATSTTNITNGQTNVYNIAGRRAISYRGMENPWGNTWRFIGGLNISGNGSQGGGVPYICSDFNYTPAQISNNYVSAGFCLPSTNGWISAMGYGDSALDWLLMPAEATGANSALPVGDNVWITTNLNTINGIQIGGDWRHGDSNGIFYYACDNEPNRYARTINARIMHIPTYNNAIYTANITSWTNQIQG